MAPSTSCFTVIVIWFISCQIGLGCKDEPVTYDIAGSTVNVDVLPDSINELITNEISITCTPQDLPLGSKDILFMELGKEGEHPLAAMKGPKLELGSYIKNNMQAKGHISKNVSESYLQLSIKRPFVDDVGVYCCRMFYQNEFGELKMGHVYADVTIENNDKAVLLHLLEKVSALEMYTKDLENNLSMTNNYTHQLETTLKEQGKELMDRETKDSFSSAFNVYGTKGSFNNGETLVFKHFLLNDGNHYDIKTGVFTAPKRGLYVFNLFVWAGYNDDFRAHVKVNDVIKASLRSWDRETYDQSSLSTILSLEVGDRVWPYASNGGKLVHIDEHYTFFNGYLQKLLRRLEWEKWHC